MLKSLLNDAFLRREYNGRAVNLEGVGIDRGAMSQNDTMRIMEKCRDASAVFRL